MPDNSVTPGQVFRRGAWGERSSLTWANGIRTLPVMKARRCVVGCLRGGSCAIRRRWPWQSVSYCRWREPMPSASGRSGSPGSSSKVSPNPVDHHAERHERLYQPAGCAAHPVRGRPTRKSRAANSRLSQDGCSSAIPASSVWPGCRALTGRSAPNTRLRRSPTEFPATGSNRSMRMAASRPRRRVTSTIPSSFPPSPRPRWSMVWITRPPPSGGRRSSARATTT